MSAIANDIHLYANVTVIKEYLYICIKVIEVSLYIILETKKSDLHLFDGGSLE
jgi:hypothetical protein